MTRPTPADIMLLVTMGIMCFFLADDFSDLMALIGLLVIFRIYNLRNY